MFWITSLLLTLGVASYLLRPLLRAAPDVQASPDIAFYKAQLAEIDRDVARDVLSDDEAERARVEVQRRLIQADARAVTYGGNGPVAVAAIAGLAVIVGVTAVTYLQIGAVGEPDLPLALRLQNAADLRENRPNQEALETLAPALEVPEDLPNGYLAQIAQLREIVPTRPDDLRGWELLSFHEAELRNFSGAAVAQGNVVRLKGDDATIEDRRLQLDYMVAATDGYVSPEAEGLARFILRLDETHIPSRYYLGALAHQTDRSDIAFRLWRPLIESGQATYHIALARLQIENAAQRAGVEYTLPEQLAGPSVEDMAAAEDMSEQDRSAMIQGMVAQLSDRLATEGGSAAEWARLISAYGVLGDTDSAMAIWIEAQTVFAANETAMDTLRAAAQSAGVAE